MYVFRGAIMRNLRFNMLFTNDEIEAIDQARKANGESRSAYIRRRVFAASPETSSGDLSSSELRLRIANLEKNILSIKENDLQAIKYHYKILISFSGKVFKWILKYIVHQISKQKMSADDIAELTRDYSIPGKEGKYSYIDFQFNKCKEQAKES